LTLSLSDKQDQLAIETILDMNSWSWLFYKWLQVGSSCWYWWHEQDSSCFYESTIFVHQIRTDLWHHIIPICKQIQLNSMPALFLIILWLLQVWSFHQNVLLGLNYPICYYTNNYKKLLTAKCIIDRNSQLHRLNSINPDPQLTIHYAPNAPST